MLVCRSCGVRYEFFRDLELSSICCKCSLILSESEQFRKDEIKVIQFCFPSNFADISVQDFVACHRCSTAFRFMKQGELCGFCLEDQVKLDGK